MLSLRLLMDRLACSAGSRSSFSIPGSPGRRDLLQQSKWLISTV
jgi:hypothetical protein